MNNFPKSKTYILFYGILILFFSYQFSISSKKQFHQLNFNWSDEKVIKNYNNVRVDSTRYNFIKFNIKDTNVISTNNTFLYKTKNSSYYFRAIKVINKSNYKSFINVLWLNKKSPKKGDNGTLFEVEIPLIQTAELTVNTIGDTFLIYNYANYLRKFITEQIDVKFVGKGKDLFSYPHDAVLLRSSTYIANYIKESNKAEIYILFMGNHDRRLKISQIEKNWIKILHELKRRKNTKNIIILSLPPSKNKETQTFREEYNLLLKKISKRESCVYIDLMLLDNAKENLDILKSYPNKEGYRKIANAIVSIIRESNENE